MLLARYASPATRARDVENLLLYNVGVSVFAHLRPEEVVLTRTWHPLPPPEGDPELLVHHHRYRLADEAGTTAQGRVLARLAAVPLRTPITVDRLWYDLRTSGAIVVESADRDGELALELKIYRPPGSAAMLGMVKGLVDDVISALHVHDGAQLEVVSERLGERLGIPAGEVAGLLATNPVAVLGERRLLWAYREFVQWNPADDTIAHFRVESSDAPTWQLSASLANLGGNRISPG